MRCYLRPIPSCQEPTVEAAARNSAFERAIKKPAPGFQVFPTQADSNKSAKQQDPNSRAIILSQPLAGFACDEKLAHENMATSLAFSGGPIQVLRSLAPGFQSQQILYKNIVTADFYCQEHFAQQH